MYYENKRTFYIKQYGPAVAIIVLSIAMIVMGLYIGFNPNRIAKAQTENNAYTFSKDAITGTVKSVDGITIILISEGEEYAINLIGIAENGKNKNLTQTMSDDLTGKEVTIDFDVLKSENGKTYGYLYLDNTFYNETLLAKGLAELRAERNNVNKLDILVAAQINARHEGLGIWNIN